VLVAGFPAGSFAANCYLVAAAPGEQCLIIDPGQDAERGIEEIVERYRLQPAAVLLTHGHVDHIWSVAPVCGARDIPAYIHPDDRALLTDPARGVSLAPGQRLFGGITFTEPDDVRELTDGAVLQLAGVEVVVDHAPGHTPGSVTFRLPAAAEPGTLFSGRWPMRPRCCPATGRPPRSVPSGGRTRSWPGWASPADPIPPSRRSPARAGPRGCSDDAHP
jgi:glyoxylase-like metal-dependent hydrolase (beta-lactamase superfamily II)